MRPSLYTVVEQGRIYREGDYLEEVSLSQITMPDASFDNLQKYVKGCIRNGKEGRSLFRLSCDRHGDVIIAQNYVGVVEFSKGEQIEILPKIFTKKKDVSVTLKSYFTKLLGTVRNFPRINPGAAQLSTQRDFPIIDIFISSYITEVQSLLNKGLKSDYVSVEDSFPGIKGKVLIAKTIREKVLAPEKCVCLYSDYTPDAPINRVIKSTLQLLLGASKSTKNTSALIQLLSHFQSVSSSMNYRADLAAARKICTISREYEQILQWTEVFLTGQSFTNVEGTVRNTSIMFPMEKVFEDFIAYNMIKYSGAYSVKPQDKSCFLVVHKDAERFQLRPDVVVRKSSSPVLILDTKWKAIDENRENENYGISQADMYQLYAYGKKYKEKFGGKPHLVLLYPANENFTKPLANYDYKGDLVLDVIPFSFDKDIASQMKAIMRFAK
ncbi:5-methylcytosine-specific restriction enzyme subunit McrC [Bacteroidales bacterium WCE2004]|nr:5-methylcytosine-specific restriction enzyme subunit McrC [Bacteroidales bacterium WCE2004]